MFSSFGPNYCLLAEPSSMMPMFFIKTFRVDTLGARVISCQYQIVGRQKYPSCRPGTQEVAA